MQDFKIDRVSARVKLGPLSFTISQDEVAEEEDEECASCHAHLHRSAGEPKYKFCPNCGAPLIPGAQLENP